MSLKKGIEILQEGVQEQLDFIKWLKEKGLYNPMESAITMCKMQAVWKAAKEDD